MTSVSFFRSAGARYTLALLVVGTAGLLRLALSAGVGAGLPPYITFYPAVMVAALLGGLGPGLLATVVSALLADYWLLPPREAFNATGLQAPLSLGVFCSMGLFMSVVAELYQRKARKAAAYDQEQALRETRQERELLANLLEHASQPFAVGYLDGRLGRFNAAFAQLTGYTAEELRALDWFAVLTPPEWRALEQPKLAELARTGQPVRYEKEYLRKDGTRVPLELLVHVARDAQGQPEYYYSFLTDITQRKQADEERTRLAEQRQLVLDAARLGWWHYDPVTQLATYDDRYAEIIGVTGSQCPNEAILARLHPDDLPGVLAKATAALNPANPIPYAAEYRVHLPDGSVRWVESHGAATFAGEGTARHAASFVGTVADITERKRAEEERERLASFPQLNPNPLVEVGFDGRVAYANPAAAALFPDLPEAGLQHAFLSGLVWTAIEARFAAAPYFVREVAAAGRTYGQTIFRVPGQARVRVYAYDLTARKRAEEQRRQSAARLEAANAELREARRATLNLVDDAVAAREQAEQALASLRQNQEDLDRAQAVGQIGSWRLDVRRNILTWSHENYRIFGVPQGTPLTYETFLATIHPDDRPPVDAQWQASLRGEPYDLEHRIVVNEQVKWVREKAYLEFDETGGLLGGFGISQDITERVRREHELREKHAELERFNYTVSHDLKSPLVTVKTFLGYLEADLARPDPERVKQDLTYLHQAADKMGRLLDELLELSRVGRKLHPPVRITLQELADEAIQLVAGLADERGVQVECSGVPVVLMGDRVRLAEIWQNLVENACKFMGKQPQPRLEIGAEVRGGTTIFFVRDNGIGLDPRYHAKVFGLFEKLDPKSPGTGLGLALVKRIVELYEGRIWVESAGLGQGTNFLFTLPRAVQTASQSS